MSQKMFVILLAIIWFCVGGLVTIFVFNSIVTDSVIKDYQNALFDCQESKLDLIK